MQFDLLAGKFNSTKNKKHVKPKKEK